MGSPVAAVVGCRDGLAAGVAARLGAAHVGADVRTFPDGEGKITLDSAPERGSPVAVVHSTSPPVDTNLVRMLSMIAEARRFTGDVTAVMPYMGYARQDRRFLDGEIVTMSAVARLVEAAGASRVVAVDAHSPAAMSHFSVPAESVPAAPLLAGHLSGLGLSDPLVVSPDVGGSVRARDLAGRLGARSASLEKKRDRHTGEVSIAGGGGVDEAAGRDIVLVDDMISTGGSIVKAAGFLRGRGCGRIFVACTHALLVDGAGARIAGAGASGIVGTNTVGGWAEGTDGAVELDAAGIVASALAGR